jgi:hypothetical protein
MKSDTEDRVRLQQELNVFRRLAFFGTVVSTVSTLVAVVVVPMTYNYMQHVHNSLMVCSLVQHLIEVVLVFDFFRPKQTFVGTVWTT